MGEGDIKNGQNNFDVFYGWPLMMNDNASYNYCPEKLKTSLLKGPNQTENWWIQDQTGMALKEINPITVFCHLVACPSYLYWNCLDFLCLQSSLVWLWFCEIWFFFLFFVNFMFSKKATYIWRNLQFMEIFYFLWLWWFTAKNDPPQTLILAHTVAIWTFTFHEKSGCV